MSEVRQRAGKEGEASGPAAAAAPPAARPQRKANYPIAIAVCTVLCGFQVWLYKIGTADLFNEPNPRIIQDKTPTPCLDKYPEELMSAAMEDHLKGIEPAAPAHLLLMFGGSGAGKGTFLKALANTGEFVPSQFVEHGLDEYLRHFPEYQSSITDSLYIYKDAADSCYSGAAIPLAKATQKKIVAQKFNCTYEETGKNLKRVVSRVLPPFQEAGYRITLVLVDNVPEVAIKRSEPRFQLTGRHAPPDYIKGTFKNVRDNFLELVGTDNVTEAVYCDNSCLRQANNRLHVAWSLEDCLLCFRAKSAENPLIPDSLLFPGPPQFMPNVEFE